MDEIDFDIALSIFLSGNTPPCSPGMTSMFQFASEEILSPIQVSNENYQKSATLVSCADVSLNSQASLEMPPILEEDSYERKKSRARILRQEISDRFDELQALLLLKGSTADTAFIKDKIPKRSAILDAAISTISSLSLKLSRFDSIMFDADVSKASKRGAFNKVNPFQTCCSSVQVLSDLLDSHAISVFIYLDPVSLERASVVCRQWNVYCSWDCIWYQQCFSRYHLKGHERAIETWCQKSILVRYFSQLYLRISRVYIFHVYPDVFFNILKENGRSRFICNWHDVFHYLHSERYLPNLLLSGFSRFSTNPANIILGCATRQGACVWVILCCRSNGMTMRTVNSQSGLHSRSAEVIELRIIVQNTGIGAGKSPSFNVPKQSIKVSAVDSSGQPSYFTEVQGDLRLSTKLISPECPKSPCIRNEKRHSWPAQPLLLFETAIFSTFLEVPGCSTEQSFLEHAMELSLNLNLNEHSNISVNEYSSKMPKKITISVPLNEYKKRFSESYSTKSI